MDLGWPVTKLTKLDADRAPHSSEISLPLILGLRTWFKEPDLHAEITTSSPDSASKSPTLSGSCVCRGIPQPRQQISFLSELHEVVYRPLYYYITYM